MYLQTPRYLLVDTSGYVITFDKILLSLKLILGRRLCDKIRTEMLTSIVVVRNRKKKIIYMSIVIFVIDRKSDTITIRSTTGK